MGDDLRCSVASGPDLLARWRCRARGGARARGPARLGGRRWRSSSARHWRRAHRAAYLVVGDSAAAEDIAQESFLAAIRAPRPVRPPAPVRRPGCTGSRSTARSTSRGRGRCARERGLPVDQPRRAPPPPSDPRGRAAARRSPTSGPSTGPWSCSATCSSTRRARSARSSGSPGHGQLAPAARPRPAARRDRGGAEERRARAARSGFATCGRPTRPRSRNGRGLAAVERAYEERPPVRPDRPHAAAGACPRRRRPARWRCGSQPAGAKVGNWISDVVGIGESATRSRRCPRCPAAAGCWFNRRTASGWSQRQRLAAAARVTTTPPPGRRTTSTSSPPRAGTLVALEPDGDAPLVALRRRGR